MQVRAPNGTIVQFPDGTPSSQINSVMAAYHDAAANSREVQAAPGAAALMNGWTFNHAADVHAAGAAMKTGLLNLVGQGPGYGMSQAFNAQKAQDQGILDSYAAQHPGANLVANVVGGMINPVSIAGGRYIGAARGLPALARAAAVGAGEGGLAGGWKGAAAGAVAAPLAVVGAAGVGKAAGMAQGIARNVQRGVGLANPDAVAARRLASAVAKDVKAGVDPRANLHSWPGVSRPTLADVTGENVRAVVRDAGTQGPARQMLARYSDRVAADLQGNALDLTRRLTPGDARTAPAMVQSAQQAVEAARLPPQTVTPGTGGAMLSDALNQRADAARSAVNSAYSAARQAAPDQAIIPQAELPNIAAGVRDAVSDFAPEDVPRVARAVGGLDNLSTPSVRDLFELRSRLSNLRASADPVEALAAGRATRALDSHIDTLHDQNLITGDPAVVGLWRNAIGQRRAFGQQFEGDDLIHALTTQERHGAGRTVAIAPEDASNAILGRSGVAPRQNLTRDLARVQDVLGADHPAWQTLQQEATERLLQQPGARFGAALDQFQRTSPELSGLLMHGPTVDAANAGRTAATAAEAEANAVGIGRRLLGSTPDQYSLDLSGAAGQMPLVRVGARQALSDTIGQPTEGAIRGLNQISTATNSGQNLAATFGDDAADAYRQGLQAEVDRMSNANWMAPQLGSKTHTSGQDAGHGLIGGIHGMIAGAAKRVLSGAPLNDAERAAIVTPSTADLSPDYLMALLKTGKPSGLFGSQYAVAPLALTSGQAAAGSP